MLESSSSMQTWGVCEVSGQEDGAPTEGVSSFLRRAHNEQKSACKPGRAPPSHTYLTVGVISPAVRNKYLLLLNTYVSQND